MVGQLFHGQPAAWPLDWSGLRGSPCHHRQLHTAGLAHVEGVADIQQATAIGFMSKAMAWFNVQGVECCHVMSDNGPAYISHRFAMACKTYGIKHIQTRSYPTRINGKAEPFIQTFEQRGRTYSPSSIPSSGTSSCPSISQFVTTSVSTQPSAAHLPSFAMISWSDDQRSEVSI